MTSREPGFTNRMNWPLLALGLSAFGIGTAEFAPMGLLPSIADGIDVSIPAAGQLVTAYAIGVMVGAPILTLSLARFSRKSALLGLMVIFILGNLFSALAPEYWSLLTGRVVTSLSQGAFFGFGAVVAMSVVPRHRQASAIATMFMGLSIANIIGVPASSWLGQTIGWRAPFAGMVLLGLLSFVSLYFALPNDGRGERPSVRSELAAMVQPHVLANIATTVLFAGAFFTVYTYIAPILKTGSGVSDGFVTFALLAIGVGLTAGNWIGGRLADWSLSGATLVSLAALTLTTLAIAWFAPFPEAIGVVLVLWATSAFAAVPALQMQVMRSASGAPTLAAALNIAAFNLGNAIGAGLGGGIIGAGYEFGAVPVVGAVLAGASIAIVAAVSMPFVRAQTEAE
ncbi:MFS transporter [Roseibium suaedae]|uniref:MFS transporter, DHA1 family, inner membrane transport protein n=1 Tax=Roseibium suaedae TaxID=735517 RepID=A0A1M7KKK3_9HYPH|nr:MFS transporter [Roseibium suaedae]SHM65909.1 MFS transporter, DHA1 family, inner membrane transport protein [Roseibium suaedae]